LITDKHKFLGFNVSRKYHAVDAWKTNLGGEYLAIGVRGAIAGRRADLVIIDDPIRSLADAQSHRQREYIWDWYKSDLTTRLKPNGKVILIMTRWHLDDLGGKILACSSGEWRVLRLPAFAEANDPLGRLQGAALWPDWEDEQALRRKRDLIGDRAWSALYQQTPLPNEGRLFRVERLEQKADLTSTAAETIVRAWDLAATSDAGRNDPDWTVGVKMARNRDGTYTIADVIRIQGTPNQVEALIVATAKADGPKIIVAIPEDPGQAGKSQAAYLTRQLAGFYVVSARETGSKATRAMPFASQVEAGNVSFTTADWNQTLMSELQEFPWGRKDDQVDALVRAFTTLASRPRNYTSQSLSVLAR
jgi:predicted phage terminase large subunit-like protein